MTALWLDWWPLICTVAFALAASLWCWWALSGQALYTFLLAVPGSGAFGYLMARAAAIPTFLPLSACENETPEDL